MVFDPALDDTDWRILRELQDDGRVTFAELGRRVALSPPSVADRVRRLEEIGVISGYRAQVDLDRLGLPIVAFIRLKYPTSNYRPLHKALADRPEVLECHHVTGDDCFVFKVATRSMRHLEEVGGHLAKLGSTTTSIVFSTPLAARTVVASDRPARATMPAPAARRQR
jgi:Lrp/AsnC family leucine-responsive transcriptional regulator